MEPSGPHRLEERRDAEAEELVTGGFDADRVRRLRALTLDPDELARPGLGYERLDQLMMEHLLGVRA